MIYMIHIHDVENIHMIHIQYVKPIHTYILQMYVWQVVTQLCDTPHSVAVCCGVWQRVAATTHVYYRVAKTHRIPYLYRSFSAKVTYISWLFCGK